MYGWYPYQFRKPFNANGKELNRYTSEIAPFSSPDSVKIGESPGFTIIILTLWTQPELRAQFMKFCSRSTSCNRCCALRAYSSKMCSGSLYLSFHRFILAIFFSSNFLIIDENEFFSDNNSSQSSWNKVL